jgi:hypothetical protein
VVDVDEDDGERMLVAPRPLELVNEPALDGAAIGDLREPVDRGELGKLLVHALELVGEPFDAQHRRHSNLELERVDGLRQKLVGACRETAPLRIDVFERGEQDDGHEGGVALEHLRELVAVDVRHHDVQEHEVGARLLVQP